MRERPRFPSRLVSGRGLLYHPRQARPARRSSVAILPSLGSEYFNGLLGHAVGHRFENLLLTVLQQSPLNAEHEIVEDRDRRALPQRQ